MALTLKLTAIGNSLGVVLPRELVSKLRIDKGDNLYVIETPDGIELTPFDPVLARQLEAAEEVMRDNRDVLRKLAK